MARDGKPSVRRVALISIQLPFRDCVPEARICGGEDSTAGFWELLEASRRFEEQIRVKASNRVLDEPPPAGVAAASARE